MAEVFSKTNLISSLHGDQQQKHHIVSIVTKNCNYNPRFACSMRRVPSLKLKLKLKLLRSSSFPSSSLESDFHGKKVVFQQDGDIPNSGNSLFRPSTAAQMTLRIGKAQKWWEKGHQPNMREAASAQDLVDSLSNAGDKLVVVDFFSPGCGGCKALHPKICQLAEMNPDVQFLQVNYEEHKSMCYSLNVHVLPFFRFYRGSHGRLCSFSCTNATIKKFKDTLAKHTPDRCSLGPAKGLEEKELLALSANRDLSFNYTPNPVQPAQVPAQEEILAEAATSRPSSQPLPLPSVNLQPSQESEGKTLVTAGR